MLPKDFPSWQTVYGHFSRWTKRRVWEAVLDALNTRYRKKTAYAGPSYGRIDAQSVKTRYDSGERGTDGGNRVRGHKRHIVVDILGNLLHVEVHASHLSDTVRRCEVLRRAAEKHPGLDAFSGDAGCRGTAVSFLDEILGLTLRISEKIVDGFAVLLKRLWGGAHLRVA